MPWVKIDDSFTDHPKVEALSATAFRLHVAGLCFCARMLSDGKIPNDRVRRLLPNVTKGMVKELVDGGLWLEVKDGYEVHGYLDYNPSKEKVLHDRAAAADRKAKFLARKAAEEAKKNAAGNGVPNGARNGSPTQPDPTQPVGHWVGVEDSQANGTTPSPSAGVAEEPGPPLEVVRSIVSETRAKSLKPKVIPGPEGSKECPCEVPWADCKQLACPKFVDAMDARAAGTGRTA